MFNTNNGFTLTYYPILQLINVEERKGRQWDLLTVMERYTWKDMHVSASVMPLVEHTHQFDVNRIKQYEDRA